MNVIIEAITKLASQFPSVVTVAIALFRFVIIVVVSVLCTGFALASCPGADEMQTPSLLRTQARANRYREIVARLPTNPVDVLVIGDSIANGWPRPLLHDTFPHAKIVNFGFGGDRTQDTLWKLRDGKLDHLNPRKVVVIIGTNNLNDSACAIAAGVLAVLDEVERRWHPKLTVSVAIPPAGRGGERHAAVRMEANRLVQTAVGTNVRIVNLDLALACADICDTYKPDMVHLSDKAYKILGRAIQQASGAP